MADRLKGKTAIVTGANSGIGEATALLFAREGAPVVLAARRAEKLEEVCGKIRAMGGQAIAVATDVTDYDACGRLADAAVEAFGKIDILINNAGIADKHRPVTRCEPDWWEHVVKVDLTSLYYMTRQALRYMEPAGAGSIVNIASIGATRMNSGAAYTAAKAGVVGLSKNLAIEFAGRGIRCNVVCPGPTLGTGMADRLFGPNGEKGGPPRFGKTSDIAATVLWLSDPANSFITGNVICADGGLDII